MPDTATMSASITVRLFGSPAVLVNGQPVTQFHSSRAAALVYYLAATNRSHAREGLATLFWSEWSDAQAKTNLRSTLYYLPDVLKPFMDVSRTAVTLHPHAVQEVDVLAFAAHLRTAQQPALDPTERARALAAAVDLYGGEFLQGFHLNDADAFDEWARGEREHYHLLAIGAHAELIAHHADRHEYLPAIDYATRLLQLEPLHEETYRRLMWMLATSGQQSAALDLFQSCRRLLTEDAGAEPEDETVELYERILAGDFAPSPRPAAQQAPALRHNLPADLTPFLGREAEVDEVRRLLLAPHARLVTIAGLGGAGKTRLATEVARTFVAGWPQQDAFADGVFFVNLAPVEPVESVGEQLAEQIALALDLALAANAPPIAQVSAMLAGKSTLLMFDNFEHLTAATPALLHLLHTVPSLKALVTSRVRLNVAGERVVPIEGLAVPAEDAALSARSTTEPLALFAATHLFVEAAEAASPDFRVDDAARVAIVHICRLLDGMPLAIELAAGWVRLLSCTEIAAEIRQDLDLLEDSRVEASGRRRSLRAVFDASWRQLTPGQQRVLRRLAIFRDGCTRNAAADVAGATLSDLALLVDHSLLRRIDAAGGAPGVTRYALQEVLRQFAAEQLDGDEELLIAGRHLEWFLAWLGRHRPALRGGDQAAAVSAIAADIENVRAAVRRTFQQTDAPAEHGVATLWPALAALFHFYDMRSWFLEGETTFRHAAEMARTWAAAAPAGSRHDLVVLTAQLDARRGWFLFHLGDYALSEMLLQGSLTTFVFAGEEMPAIFNYNYLGALFRHLGRVDEAHAMLTEARRLATIHRDDYALSTALNIEGQVALLADDLPTARQACRRALDIKRRIGDQWGMTYSLSYLGRLAQIERNDAEAHALYSESMDIYRAIGDRRGIAFASRNLGDIAYRRGEYAEAERLYQASLALYREIGARMEASQSLSRLGEAALAQQEDDAAELLFFDALRLARGVRSTPAMIAALLGLAALAVQQRTHARAAALLHAVQMHRDASQEQRGRAAQLAALLAVADLSVPADHVEPLEHLVDDLLINHAPLSSAVA